MNSLQAESNDSLDILALLDQEDYIMSSTTGITATVNDPLAQLMDVLPEIIEVKEINSKLLESPLVRFKRFSIPKIQFAFYYLSISTIVFIILMTSTNWNSYSTILSAYINPQDLIDSKNDIISVLDKSRVVVYADHTNQEDENQEEQDNLKKKLEASNTIIREDRFSPKKLIPIETKISIDLEITPYDNRIIIPKI